MNIALPNMEYEDLNCRLGCVATILQYHNTDFSAALCNSLCFEYNGGAPLVDGAIYFGNKKDKEDLLETIYNLNIIQKKILNPDCMMDMICKSFKANKVPWVKGMIYDCIYNSKIVPENYPHYSLVSEYDKNSGFVSIHDPYLKVFDTKINCDDLYQFAKTYLYYDFDMLNDEALYKDKKRLLEYSIHTLLRQVESNNYYLAIQALANTMKEVETFQDIVNNGQEYMLRLVNIFMSYKSHVIAYKRFLNYVFIEDDCKNTFYKYLDDIAYSWSEICSTILKYFIKNNEFDIACKILFEKLVHISNVMEALLDSLVSIKISALV